MDDGELITVVCRGGVDKKAARSLSLSSSLWFSRATSANSSSERTTRPLSIMNPKVPERKVGSPCQLETEMSSSLAHAKEEDGDGDDDEDEDEEDDDDDKEKVETKPRSTTFLASTPASLFSTPGATETVI